MFDCLVSEQLFILKKENIYVTHFLGTVASFRNLLLSFRLGFQYNVSQDLMEFPYGILVEFSVNNCTGIRKIVSQFGLVQL
jgi:hypothetical protein